MNLYKQQGRFGMYTLTIPGYAGGPGMRHYLPVDYGDMWFYFKGEQCILLLQEERMEAVSSAFFALAQGSMPAAWQADLNQVDHELIAAAKAVRDTDLAQESSEQLWARYQALYDLQQRMWALTIFIDCLDNGADRREIDRIAAQHGFSQQETQTLLAPTAPSFIVAWEQQLAKANKGEVTHGSVADHFFWYGTDYLRCEEITPDHVRAACEAAREPHLEDVAASQSAILATHGLEKNPLELFQTLSLWRDERKRMNFTGLYGLCRLLREGLSRQQIPEELMYWLLPTEAEAVFQGKTDRAVLERRQTDGALVHLNEQGEATAIDGAEAQAELQRLLTFLPAAAPECKGMVASPGNATGRVRVVLDASGPEASAFQPGEILVTSMTRPEFLPLAKLSAAIVTNEGGISCHAAILARELGKPCVIGTKHATTMFKTGDTVVVDALKGIVKKT